MASSLAGLSASVTRILSLTGFPKELKTKDIQAAFADWDGVNGGFKIKWRDDTSLLIVFQDAAVAKRAYLSAIAFPPPILTAAATGTPATLRPYDGPDAQDVITSVNARGPARAHAGRSASLSVFPPARRPDAAAAAGREPSPTLPSLPAHPTLNALISSSLALPADPAIVASGAQAPPGTAALGAGAQEGGPRIGDPGKRMLGAALGVRHPGLPPRAGGAGAGGAGAEAALREVQRAMGGLAVGE